MRIILSILLACLIPSIAAAGCYCYCTCSDPSVGTFYAGYSSGGPLMCSNHCNNVSGYDCPNAHITGSSC